jgi:hypothetical protein
MTFHCPIFTGTARIKYDNFCLATVQDDSAYWSTFVYWVAESTIYAEESDASFNENEMPQVYLFGPMFRRMFRDAILAVGSYADISFTIAALRLSDQEMDGIS